MTSLYGKVCVEAKADLHNAPHCSRWTVNLPPLIVENNKTLSYLVMGSNHNWYWLKTIFVFEQAVPSVIQPLVENSYVLKVKENGMIKNEQDKIMRATGGIMYETYSNMSA